jgi:NAD(P)-dependent dehydrogenase (short-subunit alcohol dehydrogenase family)
MPAGGEGSIRTEVADAADAGVAGSLINRYEPEIIVVSAGATPVMRPLQLHTWESFSLNWNADVRIAFNWLREALLRPLRPGSRVIVVSSGAAIGGSSLSGGYAGAKATQRFITGYAQEEARRADLSITFTAVLPQFVTPLTEISTVAVRAYAARSGLSEKAFLERQGPLVTTEGGGAALVGLVLADAGAVAPAYLLTAGGLKSLP